MEAWNWWRRSVRILKVTEACGRARTRGLRSDQGPFLQANSNKEPGDHGPPKRPLKLQVQ